MPHLSNTCDSSSSIDLPSVPYDSFEVLLPSPCYSEGASEIPSPLPHVASEPPAQELLSLPSSPAKPDFVRDWPMTQVPMHCIAAGAPAPFQCFYACSCPCNTLVLTTHSSPTTACCSNVRLSVPPARRGDVTEPSEPGDARAWAHRGATVALGPPSTSISAPAPVLSIG